MVLIKTTLPARRWTAKEFTDTHSNYGDFIADFHVVQQTPLCGNLSWFVHPGSPHGAWSRDSRGRKPGVGASTASTAASVWTECIKIERN